MDNCKIAIGNYLRTQIIAFDICIKNIIKKIKESVKLHTNTNLTTEQLNNLHKCLSLQLYEVPNTLSFIIPTAPPSTNTNTNTNLSTNSFSFNNNFNTNINNNMNNNMNIKPDTNKTITECLNVHRILSYASTASTNPSEVINTTNTQNNSNFSSFTSFSNSTTNINTTVPQLPIYLNVKTIIQQLCKPIFTMEQFKADIVSGNPNINLNKIDSDIGINGIDCLAEYEQLISFFLTILIYCGNKTMPNLNNDKLFLLKLIQLNLLQDKELKILRYTINTTVDILHLKSMSISKSPNVSNLSIAYCMMYHLRVLVDFNDSLIKIIW